MFTFDPSLKITVIGLLVVTRLMGLHHLSWFLITLSYWLPPAYSASKRLVTKQASRSLHAAQARLLHSLEEKQVAAPPAKR